jgi:hypothetical protein
LLKAAYKPLAEGVGVRQSPGRLKLVPESDPHPEYKVSQFQPVKESRT